MGLVMSDVFLQVCHGCHSECEVAPREKLWKQELLKIETQLRPDKKDFIKKQRDSGKCFTTLEEFIHTQFDV